MADLYDTLGVARHATRDDIRKAYRAKAAQTHPDRGGSKEAFQAIELAHRILSDDDKRAHYDQTGDADKPPDQTDAIAMKILADLIEQIGDDDIYRDMAAEMRTAIGEVRANATNVRDSLAKKETRLTKLRDRFTTKSKSDVVKVIFERRLNAARREKLHAEMLLAGAVRALDLMADYQFKADKRPKDQSPYATMSKNNREMFNQIFGQQRSAGPFGFRS